MTSLFVGFCKHSVPVLSTGWTAFTRTFVGLIWVGVLSACAVEFPNLKGEYIDGSEAEELVAETEAAVFHSPKHFKMIYFHVNRHMRLCLIDKPNAYRGYILDSNLDEANGMGELGTFREKMGFGIRAETVVIIRSAPDGSEAIIHTREPFQLEKWYKWFHGEEGCFPELLG